jgi:chromosome segregation ATPase
MDETEELRRERERVRKLEEELSSWHGGVIEKLTPEELASTVHTQQVESLTYHLLKLRQRISQLEAEIKSREDDVEKAHETVESLEDELESKTVELQEVKAHTEPEREQASGQRISAAVLVSDDEIDELLEDIVSEPKKPKLKASKRTFRDFVRLVRRMERIKLFDASLLLDVGQEVILKWARKLEAKGYVVVEGRGEKRVVATEKMLRTR